MRQTLVAALGCALALGAVACAPVEQDGRSSSSTQAALEAAVAGPARTPANVARDRYRHPIETLSFFGVEPDDTIVEIWPGGGWYTEILAPYVASGGGRLYAASHPGAQAGFEKMKAERPQIFGNVINAAFPLLKPEAVGVPDGVADAVLTFRNVHNWRMGAGNDQHDYGEQAFREMYRMLKPGGVLGITDHRLPESASDERERTSGYVKVSTVRRLAEQAGFRFAGSSEVNANPKDSTDWPSGVWTLPPVLRLGDQDRDKYLAIGESDRMTLKFVKPR